MPCRHMPLPVHFRIAPAQSLTAGYQKFNPERLGQPLVYLNVQRAF